MSDSWYTEKKMYARCLALTHLYLKVQFWLIDFEDRKVYVTEWAWDGWIDGYYIDEINLYVYIIQSKFRLDEENFLKKEIKVDELLNIEIKRILKWEKTDESWHKYNGRILGFQRKIEELSKKNTLNYQTIIIANLNKKITDKDICTVLWSFKTDIVRFNYELIYNKLIFPVISWTYFKQENLTLNIETGDVQNEKDCIDYKVCLKKKNLWVMVMYVPTKEIWKALYKYKNAILEYNPRSYLEMKSWNVNSEIYNSIISNDYNEFALYNNWITILCSNAEFNNAIGKKWQWILKITNPQIINWWQTSFTLSRIYEDVINNNFQESIFDNKTVLLKVIKDIDLKIDGKIIEKISRATNRQSYVKDADRKSNDEIQIKIQNEIYRIYWFFYERKTWEFAEWIKSKYINADLIIKREVFLKMALCTQFDNEHIWNTKTKFKNPKNTTESWLFSDWVFNWIFDKKYFNIEQTMYNYYLYLEIRAFKNEQRKDKKDKDWLLKYWNALRYWEIWLVLITGKYYYNKTFKKEEIKTHLYAILEQWKDFEICAERLPTNSAYFDDTLGKKEYYQYYKSENFIYDLRQYKNWWGLIK